MAQPANVPRWNTDGSNRTDPPSGQKDTGQVAGAPLDSSYFNWNLFTIYQWILYLQGLAAEAFTWTAAHIFQSGITVTNATVNGSGVTSTGNGTGAGLKGFGGANGDGVWGTAGASGGAGVRGTGATGGSGGYFIGGATNGTGVEGYAGGGNAYGFFGMGSGNLHGIKTYGGATGAGGYFIGGATSGYGLIAEGTGSAAGIFSTGAGVGVGVYGVGGATAAAGGSFLGGNNGGVGAVGIGLIAVGASPATGTGAAGISATGGSGASGITATGGAGITAGITATGGLNSNGSVGGPGLIAINPQSSGGTAIDCRGNIDFDNAGALGPGAAVRSKLTKRSFAKSLAKLSLNGGATPTIPFGINCSAVAQDVAGDVTVTFAFSMSNTDYMIDSDIENTLTGSCLVTKVVSKTTGGFVLRIFQVDNAAVVINRNDSSGYSLNFAIYGDQ